MKKFIVPLALTVLLFVLSGCAGDEENVVLPTTVPLYTPAPPVVIAPLESVGIASAPGQAIVTVEPIATETPQAVDEATVEAEVVEAETPEILTPEVEETPSDVVAPEATTPEATETRESEIAIVVDDTETVTETTGIVITTIDVLTAEERAAAEDETATEATGVVTSTLDVIIPEGEGEEETDAPVIEIATVEVTEPTPTVETTTPEIDVVELEVVTPEATIEVTEPTPTAEAATPEVDVVEPEIIIPEATVETETVAPEEETTEEAASQLPENIAAALAQADPAAGEQLVLANGCTACHSMQEGVVQVGPSWYNLAGHAETRVEGQSAEYYLYNSIIHPNEYLVEGFLANLMPQVYETTLSDQQLADIIAYLLTLHGEE